MLCLVGCVVVEVMRIVKPVHECVSVCVLCDLQGMLVVCVCVFCACKMFMLFAYVVFAGLHVVSAPSRPSNCFI